MPLSGQADLAVFDDTLNEYPDRRRRIARFVAAARGRLHAEDAALRKAYVKQSSIV
jgi:hypothetical protein